MTTTTKKAKRTKYRYFYSRKVNILRRINANCLSDKAILICLYGKKVKPIKECDSTFTGLELVKFAKLGRLIEVTYHQGLHYCKGNCVE